MSRPTLDGLVDIGRSASGFSPIAACRMSVQREERAFVAAVLRRLADNGIRSGFAYEADNVWRSELRAIAAEADPPKAEPTLAEAARQMVDALIPQFLTGPNALIGATGLNDAKDALSAALRREAQAKPDVEAAARTLLETLKIQPYAAAVKGAMDDLDAALEAKR